MKCFSELLSDALAISNITQTALAKHIGCSSRTISSYATGKSEPDYLTMLRICAFLHIDLNAQVVGLRPDVLSVNERYLIKMIRDLKISDEHILKLIDFLQEFNHSKRT